MILDFSSHGGGPKALFRVLAPDVRVTTRKWVSFNICDVPSLYLHLVYSSKSVDTKAPVWITGALSNYAVAARLFWDFFATRTTKKRVAKPTSPMNGMVMNPNSYT